MKALRDIVKADRDTEIPRSGPLLALAHPAIVLKPKVVLLVGGEAIIIGPKLFHSTREWERSA